MKETKNKEWIRRLDIIIKLIDKDKYNLALTDIDSFLKATNFERNYVSFLKGMVLGRLDNIKESISLLNNLLKKDLKNDLKLMILISKGETLTNSNKFKQAIYALDQALKILPQHHTALEYKARAQMGMKQYDKALITFKKAQAKGCTCISAMANMGICYLHKKEYDKSLGLFLEVLKKDSADVTAMKLIFNAYYQKKDIKKANEYIDKILKHEKRFPWFAYKADILVLLKDYKKAIPYYKKALDSCKKCPHFKGSCIKISAELLAHYADVLYRVKNFDEASKLVNEGLKLNQLNSSLRRLKRKLNRMK